MDISAIIARLNKCLDAADKELCKILHDIKSSCATYNDLDKAISILQLEARYRINTQRLVPLVERVAEMINEERGKSAIPKCPMND